MALIDCPECGRQVSDKAPSCPGCGVLIAAQFPAEPEEREWDPAELEEWEFRDRSQRHRVYSVGLFFAGLLLGSGMKHVLGIEQEDIPWLFVLAQVLAIAGMGWLIGNELRTFWYYRKHKKA